MNNDASGKSALERVLVPCAWRYVPSDVWSEQVITNDPRAVEIANEFGRKVDPLYDQAALDAAVAAERERCAKVCEDSDVYQYDDPGGFFANLIRNA